MDYWGGGGSGGKGNSPPPPFPKLLGGGAKGMLPSSKLLGAVPLPAPLFLRLCVFRERLSSCLVASFPYGFEGGMWYLIISIPDHCLFFILTNLIP